MIRRTLIAASALALTAGLVACSSSDDKPVVTVSSSSSSTVVVTSVPDKDDKDEKKDDDKKDTTTVTTTSVAPGGTIGDPSGLSLLKTTPSWLIGDWQANGTELEIDDDGSADLKIKNPSENLVIEAEIHLTSVTGDRNSGKLTAVVVDVDSDTTDPRIVKDARLEFSIAEGVIKEKESQAVFCDPRALVDPAKDAICVK